MSGIVKVTYSNPAALDFDKEGITNGQGKKIANSCELTFIKLTGNGASGYVELYDATDSSGAIYANLKLAMDSSQQTPDSEVFVSPLQFSKGIYAVIQQGAGFGNVLAYATTGNRPDTSVFKA